MRLARVQLDIELSPPMIPMTGHIGTCAAEKKAISVKYGLDLSRSGTMARRSCAAIALAKMTATEIVASLRQRK